MISALLSQVDVGGIEFVDQVWWFTSRAAGSVAWVLLSCSMIIGMSQSRRGSGPLPAGWSLDLHRFLSMLSLVFLTIHLGALVPDNFVEFGLLELFVPMMSTWQPAAVAWGVVGFWLLVSVELTSLLRARIPHRVWRTLHLLSFVVWVSATVHLFMAGTDVSHWVFRVVQAVMIGLVSLMFGSRIIDVARSSAAAAGALTVEEPIDVDEVDAGKGRELAA